MLNVAPGAAVCGIEAEVERTPPVRRPERREALEFVGGAVDMFACRREEKRERLM